MKTLRARVVAAAALAIVLAIVVLGVGVQILVGRHLHRSLDQTLRARAVDVARLSVSAPALLTAPGALDSPLGGRQLSVEILDRHARLVARSLALGGRVLPISDLVHRTIDTGRGGYADSKLGDEPARIYVAPLADVSGPAAGGAVIVASSTRELEDTLAQVRGLLVLTAIVAAALAALAAAVLMGRALRPVERLSRAAAEIERTGDARRRLPVPEADDEVGRLADTLNRMLASLEQARDAERRFVADASHELRTPLTALRGNVAYLARHGAGRDVVADLEADAARLAQLIDDLLVLSREDAGEPPLEEVRLDELARAAVEDDPSVVVDAPAPVRVRGDRASLERALANLIQNAQRYGDGRVTVRAEQRDGVARLSVSDEGSGLQPYEAEHAFERFWRGQHGKAGSGLGLAIVRATAERHGGRATVEGSLFAIELPALRDLSRSRGTTGEPESEKGRP
jgi:signal transduction histidine kinase